MWALPTGEREEYGKTKAVYLGVFSRSMVKKACSMGALLHMGRRIKTDSYGILPPDSACCVASLRYWGKKNSNAVVTSPSFLGDVLGRARHVVCPETLGLGASG